MTRGPLRSFWISLLLSAGTGAATAAVHSQQFEQTFDLAPPGRAFACYSKGVMKRVKG